MGYLLVACWGPDVKSRGGGWEGVLYVHLDLVRSGHLSAK